MEYEKPISLLGDSVKWSYYKICMKSSPFTVRGEDSLILSKISEEFKMEENSKVQRKEKEHPSKPSSRQTGLEQ